MYTEKWSLNRGGLLIEVKMHGKATIGTRPSGPFGGLLIEVKMPQLGHDQFKWSLNRGGL